MNCDVWLLLFLPDRKTQVDLHVDAYVPYLHDHGDIAERHKENHDVYGQLNFCETILIHSGEEGVPSLIAVKFGENDAFHDQSLEEFTLVQDSMLLTTDQILCL